VVAKHVGYITIAADGTLTRHPEEPDGQRIGQEVGPEGWDSVPMGRGGIPGRSPRRPPRQHLHGFVNDIGLLAPETYPRNPVGGCVLAAFGASQQPYAGTVVITGWDPDSERSEIRPLGEFDVADIELVHAAVVGLLGRGEPSPFGPAWDAHVAAYAAVVRDGEVPPITVVSAHLGGDVPDRRGQRGPGHLGGADASPVREAGRG
jgi:hypothetical protein